MKTLSNWIRKIHRWLSMPLLTVVIILIFFTIRDGENFKLPPMLGTLGIVALVSLVLTGTYMFAQHYLSKWRRSVRLKRARKPILPAQPDIAPSADS